MPTRQVTIQGVMTWDEPASVPPGIWGPTDPRPTPPIHIPSPPLGIWGPGDPRPTPPIHLGPGGEIGGPPVIGGGPIYPPGIWGPTDPRPGYGLPGPPLVIWGPPGPWPTPPIHLPPDRPGGGGSVQPPAAGVPIHGTMTFVPGYGYVFMPDAVGGGGEAQPPEPEPKA